MSSFVGFSRSLVLVKTIHATSSFEKEVDIQSCLRECGWKFQSVSTSTTDSNSNVHCACAEIFDLWLRMRSKPNPSGVFCKLLLLWKSSRLKAETPLAAISRWAHC
eukprot:3969778-Amphidinium_carterae.1